VFMKLTAYRFLSRFLIPGMRLGWITVHDRHERFGQLVCIMLPNCFIQYVSDLTEIFSITHSSFFESLTDVILILNRFERG